MSENNNIMVSICCSAYNHEKYIRQALDSFVNQKTNFKYEILVHDDASTDGTADIIREYEEKYPDLIKPIYQTENQYSKGVRISWTYQYPRVKGKYIALCEGDDYWCGETKLQEQFDLMEKNTGVIFCSHKVRCVTEEGEEMEETFPSVRHGVVEGLIKSEDFVKILMGQKTSYPFQTSSYFVRGCIIQKMLKETPAFVTRDIGFMWYFACHGDAYYLDKELSRYRRNVPGSWTDRNKKFSLEEYNKRIESYMEFNKYTNGKYKKEMKNAIYIFKMLRIRNYGKIYSFKELIDFAFYIFRRLFQKLTKRV